MQYSIRSAWGHNECVVVRLAAPLSQMYVWMDVTEVVLVVSRQAGSGPNRYWSETVILDSYSGPKRGRESLDEVRGADRITRPRSMASGRGDNSDGLAQGSAGPAGAEGGPVVRSARSSDWAAYLIREGQNARLEAWRNNHGLCGLFARAGTRSWVPTLHIS